MEADANGGTELPGIVPDAYPTRLVGNLPPWRSTLLMFAGLVGVRRTLPEGGLSGALARLGIHAAVIGTVLGVVTIILDGVAAKQLADDWAAAPPGEKRTALRIVAANETTNFALAGSSGNRSGVDR